MTAANELLAQINTAVTAGDPYQFAGGLQTVLKTCRNWAAEGDWAAFRPLADALDDLLEERSPQTADETALAALITLARQVCVVLALMGDAGGERDTGFFRASMTHARRLDAMTEGRLQLVALVDMVSG
jgi:hypothetical protein